MNDVRLRIPTTTLLKLLAFAGAVWAMGQLWTMFLVFLITVLLAVTLDPIVAWLMRHKLSRGWAVGVIAVGMLALVAGLVAFLVPAVIREATHLAADFPNIRARFEAEASHSAWLRKLYDRLALLPESPELKEPLSHPLAYGALAVEGLIGIPVVLIVTLYLLLDGRAVYAWLLAFVPRAQREKTGNTVEEMSRVIYAYVRGQVITSALVGLFSFGSLKLLHVPAPVALAVIAALFDVIPFVGFIAFTVPAVLLALAVSPVTALIVLVLYVAYHFVENYLIVPAVYGKQLRLSTLTVILALGIAGALTGVIGAILVLPLVAAYPIVERIWLRPVVGEEPLKDHAALEAATEKKDESAVDRVIEGEEHPKK